MSAFDFLNIKQGYNLNEKPEFQKVREFIINNGFSVRNFDKNLNTLFIKNSPYSLPKYDAVVNRITGNSTGSDFIHELFHMSSNIDNGHEELGALFDSGLGESLNEGITDYLTLMVDKEGKRSYPVEVLYYTFLNQMYPELSNDILKCYFLGKPSELYNLFGEDKNIILKSIVELDKYTVDNKSNSRKAINIYDIIQNGDKELMANSISGFISDTILNEELTNAFSILINNSKNDIMASNLIDEFEDEIYKFYEKDDANKIIDLFNSKISIGRSL